MNIARYYKIQHFLPWTKHHLLTMFCSSLIPTGLYYFLGWKWLGLPWPPVALIGTATAFIAGFKNTQSYNRLWEARQIYGAIINTSRTLGIMIKDFIRINTNESEIHKTLLLRHFAWLTALRYQLRESKPWENIKSKPYNKAYLKYYQVPEWENTLEQELALYLDPAEISQILSTKNRATQLLAKQSEALKKLHQKSLINDYNYTALTKTLKDLYDQQGRCERIKNFPYPRQFSSINLYFTYSLCFYCPMGS